MDNSLSAPLLGGRYQLLQTLGTGGMSVVHLAKDIKLKRSVAVKVLREDYSNNATFRQQFIQEAEAVANLSHPNIVTVHDFGLENDKLFLVMEYVPGTNLKTILKQRGRLSIQEALPLIIQACNGIGYAHRAGLIHCDIKPHNMLVTPDQRLKVTDFGIARALSTIRPDEYNDVVWGSPSYLSPEQAAGAAPSPASDVYSLGIVLYEVLTAAPPFASEDPVELIRLHRDTPPASPRKINAQIPVPLEQIILKVLSKEPSSRYRTADQLGRVLETFLQQYQQTQHPVAQSVPPPQTAQAVVFSTSTQKQNEIIPELLDEPAKPIDWGTILLGLLTILVVGGLIPYWLYIWLSLSPK